MVAIIVVVVAGVVVVVVTDAGALYWKQEKKNIEFSISKPPFFTLSISNRK